VALDAAGNGPFEAQLFLDLETSEDGDENLYLLAAADCGDTLHVLLQPWSSDFALASASDWELRPFGTTLNRSPALVTLTPEELGIPEPTSLALLSLGGPLNSAEFLSRNHLHCLTLKITGCTALLSVLTVSRAAS
jgi:hypothetical protein